MLILSSFEKALTSLEVALKQDKDEFIRDAVIQRFEYSYELSWKMLRRFLINDVGSETIAPLSRKDLFRLAANKKLIQDPLPWFKYHKARNETAHTYDELKAEEVYAVAIDFLTDAQRLLAELKHRNKND